MANPKGVRIGGRQKGTPNKAPAARAAAIAASGLTPLDYMLKVMRDEKLGLDVRLEAAKSVAPYVHPRLASTEIRSPDGSALSLVIQLSK